MHIIAKTGKTNMAKRVKFTKNELIAIDRFQKGEQYSVSEFIDEDTIIAGYGKLDYDFEFPLPTVYIKQIYGTTSWNEWRQHRVNTSKLKVEQFLVMALKDDALKSTPTNESIKKFINERTDYL